MNGMKFNPMMLYPGVSFPVSKGTPMISPLIQWDHSISWDVPKLEQFSTSGSGSGATFDIDISPDSPDNYLIGHTIDGRVLFPATGYLVLAWKTLAKLKGQTFEQLPVKFENVQIHRATILPHDGEYIRYTKPIFRMFSNLVGRLSKMVVTKSKQNLYLANRMVNVGKQGKSGPYFVNSNLYTVLLFKKIYIYIKGDRLFETLTIFDIFKIENLNNLSCVTGIIVTEDFLIFQSLKLFYFFIQLQKK